MLVAAKLMMAALGGDCDPLVPEYCMLPFPNDYWRSNETGRINIGEATFPMTNGGDPISPSIGGMLAYQRNDQNFTFVC